MKKTTKKTAPTNALNADVKKAMAQAMANDARLTGAMFRLTPEALQELVTTIPFSAYSGGKKKRWIDPANFKGEPDYNRAADIIAQDTGNIICLFHASAEKRLAKRAGKISFEIMDTEAFKLI